MAHNYKKTIWVNEETPLSDVNLNNLEEGVENAHLDIALLESQQTNTKESLGEQTIKLQEVSELLNETVNDYNLLKKELNSLHLNTTSTPLNDVILNSQKVDSLMFNNTEDINARATLFNYIAQKNYDDHSDIVGSRTLAIFSAQMSDKELHLIGTVIRLEDSEELIIALYNEDDDKIYTLDDSSIEENYLPTFNLSKFLNNLPNDWYATYIDDTLPQNLFIVINNPGNLQHLFNVIETNLKTLDASLEEFIENAHIIFQPTIAKPAIPKDSDLNSYREEGLYYYPTNAAHVYIHNTPTSERFLLKVHYPLGPSYSNRIIQEVVDSYGERYTRSSSNSGSTWEPWSKVITEKNTGKPLSLTNSEQIVEGDNLNAFVNPGMYRFTYRSGTRDLINCPTDLAFAMEVSYTLRLASMSKYLTQKIVDRECGVYLRTTGDNGKTWTNWKKLLTEEDLPEQEPIEVHNKEISIIENSENTSVSVYFTTLTDTNIDYRINKAVSKLYLRVDQAIFRSYDTNTLFDYFKYSVSKHIKDAYITFRSGETPTTITQQIGLIENNSWVAQRSDGAGYTVDSGKLFDFYGDDCSNKSFTPKANTTYTMTIRFNGFNFTVDVHSITGVDLGSYSGFI